jgi:hypothetical protein
MQGMDNNGADIRDLWRRKKGTSEALLQSATEMWKQWKSCIKLGTRNASANLK